MKKKLRQLIAKGKAGQVIQLLLEITEKLGDEGLQNEALSQSSKYELYAEEKRLGASSREDQRIIIARINQALTYLVSQLPEEWLEKNYPASESPEVLPNQAVLGQEVNRPVPKVPPVLFFAFANDKLHSLALKEEEDAIRNILTPCHDQRYIEFFSLGQTTFENIFAEFNRFYKRIFLFHFGGHSDGGHLNLFDTPGRSKNLATIFGQEKNLKIVFLNGCSNREQVTALFRKGVPAVIATSAPVDDKRSILLAKQFYSALAAGKSLRQSFDLAKVYVKNNHPGLNIVCRSFGTGGLKGKGRPWGLYFQDESVLDWTIYPPEKPPPPNPEENWQDFIQRIIKIFNQAYVWPQDCDRTIEMLQAHKKELDPTCGNHQEINTIFRKERFIDNLVVIIKESRPSTPLSTSQKEKIYDLLKEALNVEG